MSGEVRVVKLGGSLLEWPELAARVRGWLALEPAAIHVFVVGGGTLVDKLRELDRAHAFPPETAHWLAVRAMSLTAGALARWLPDWTLVHAVDELRLSGSPRPQIFDVDRFLREDQARSDALPASWEVTSDSIAARLATALGAGELVLLKSALPDGSASHEAWAQSGYVDSYFPRAAARLRVRAVNLRSDGFRQIFSE